MLSKPFSTPWSSLYSLCHCRKERTGLPLVLAHVVFFVIGALSLTLSLGILMLRFQLKCLSNLLPLQLSGSQTIAAFTVAPQTRMFSIYQSSRTLSRCFHTCPVTNSNSKSRTGFLLLCITKGCQERKMWYYCAESVAATQDIKTKNIQWYLNHYTEQETGSSQTHFLDSQLLVYREKFGSLHLKLHMQFLDFKLSILILYVPQCQGKKSTYVFACYFLRQGLE